jgi:hypothetical protein
MHNSVLFRVLQALGGFLLIAVAVNSDWADAMANYAYGSTINPVAGMVMWSVGLLLVILPATTVLVPKGKGYGIALWVIWTACVWASYQCSTATYSHGQAEAHGSQAGKHGAHLAAVDNIDAARKRLAENAGPGNASMIGVQVAGAETDLAAATRAEDTACKGRRAAASDNCANAKGVTLAARQSLAGARTLLAKAQERDSARVDLAAAETEAKVNPDSIVEDRKEGATQALAAVQLLLTLLSKLGMVILADAAKSPAVKPQKAKRRETGEGPTLGGTPLPANVTLLVPRKRDMRKWLESATVAEAGAEIQLGALRKEYRRTGAELGADDLRASLQAVLPAGTVIPRNSGYVIAGRRLKTADERQTKRRAVI